MLSVLRRKSSRGGRDMHFDSQLLADVQQCCSALGQQGLVPDEHSVNRAVSSLQHTEDPDAINAVLRYLGGGLKSDTHKTVMLTLSTLGFLMRADHVEFQRMLCMTSHVLKPLTTIAEYRRKSTFRQDLMDQSDLALQLVQCWAETIQGENDTQEILTLYKDLKKKDYIRWPPRNHLYDCDIATARREVSVDNSAPPPPRKPASLRPSSLRTFSSEDTEWMRKDFDQFEVLITCLDTELNRCADSKELEENALIPELVAACDKIGPQLRSMIEIISHTSKEDPAALKPLLEMNDRLLRVFEKQKEVAQRAPKPREVAYNPFDDHALLAQVLTSTSYQPYSPMDLPPLAPAGYSGRPEQPRRPPPTRPAPAPAVTMNPFGDEEDLL
jgi:hypothetical protein